MGNDKGWDPGLDQASQVAVYTDNFSGGLSSDDYTVQIALETIDTYIGTMA